MRIAGRGDQTALIRVLNSIYEIYLPLVSVELIDD
jgi:hypothetical protein